MNCCASRQSIWRIDESQQRRSTSSRSFLRQERTHPERQPPRVQMMPQGGAVMKRSIVPLLMAGVLSVFGAASALAQTQGRAPSKITEPDPEDHTDENADVSRQLANP